MIKKQLNHFYQKLVYIVKACYIVFRKPFYLISLFITTLVFLIILLLPTNSSILINIFVNESIPIFSRIKILYYIMPLTGGPTYSLINDILIYIVSIIVSTNIVMGIYQLKERGLELRNSASGATGSTLSILAAGCASCGSAILSGILSALGVASFVTLLPLAGAEFLIVALIISSFSIYGISVGLTSSHD